MFNHICVILTKIFIRSTNIDFNVAQNLSNIDRKLCDFDQQVYYFDKHCDLKYNPDEFK